MRDVLNQINFLLENQLVMNGLLQTYTHDLDELMLIASLDLHEYVPTNGYCCICLSLSELFNLIMHS